MSNLFNNPDDLVDVVRQILSGKPLEEKKKEEELDPVNKQAVKKKFDDRKDKDIDNDGDVDSTDKYLHKRRKAISKALNEKEPKKKINASHCEEVEIDEAKYEYDEKEGVAKISKKDFAKLPKDYKGSDPKKPTMLMLTKKGTSLVPVKFTEEVELDEENLEENAAAIAALKKAYEPLRGKKISPENSKRLNDIVKKFDNNKSMLMKIAKADIPFVSDAAITRLITKHNMKGAEIKAAMKEEKRNCGCEQDPCITYGDQTVKEAADEDSDGEKKTAAQKADMDGDGKKDTGEKKKKKKKDEKGEKEDEAKPDKVDTEPEMDNVKTMMSEREMTDKEKAKLDKLKKKYEGGEMHKSMKAQYGDKADEVFYGKLTKMAMGEGIDFNDDAEYLEEKQIDALKKKAEKTGIPYGILKQVYNRGMAAWRTGHRPGTTPQQWAFARVNSFATKSKGTWGGADKDLAAKARGSMKKEEVELDELSSKTLSNYMRKASDARGHRKLSTKKQDNRYSGVARAGKKLDDRERAGVREEVGLDEDKKELAKISKELEGASKMHKGQSVRIKKILDKGDMKEAKDGEEKDTNLIMQLRKAVSLRGNTVNFANGPEKVPANVANAFLMKYAKMKRPAEKDMMTKSGGKSLNHLKLAIKGKFEKPKNPLDLPKMKSEK